jgi:hypothetical protein
MKPRPDLAIENVDGELVVLDKAAGKVHQLNPSASFVWSCLSDGLDTREIAVGLAEAYGIEPQNALADVQATLAQFEGLSLVTK